MRKLVFEHLIRPSLSANRIIGHYKIYKMESKCPDENLRMRATYLNLCILRMLEGTFSLGAAHISCHCVVSEVMTNEPPCDKNAPF